MSLAKQSLLLLAAQVVLRVGDAALPLLLAAWFGRTASTDVYFFAWAAFLFAGTLIFSLYQDSAIVPILAELRMRSHAELEKTLGSLLAHTLLIGSALAGVIGVLALVFFSLRYDGSELALAARMVPLFSVMLVVTSIKTFFSAVMNAHNRFFAGPFAGTVGIACAIGIMAAMHGRSGIIVVPAATLAGELICVMLLRWLVSQLGVSMPLTLARPAPVLEFFRLAASEVGGSAVTRINPVVDQMIATFAVIAGAGTMLRYSGDVATIPTGLLAASLLPVLLSKLSYDFAGGDLAHFRATVVRTLLWVLLILTVLSFALFAVREPLMRILFLRGEMDEAGVARMVRLLPYHLAGVPSFGALLVLARAHVAMKNGRIMIGMGILNAALNVVFDILLLRAIGLEGIALATSAMHTAIAVVFWFRLEARMSELRTA